MCGRFTLTVRPEAMLEAYPVVEVPTDWEPRYNVAPSQNVAVIANREPDRVQLFRWGLVPFWAKDEKVGYKMINARADSLAQKPAFRKPLEKRRCLVLSDGFYEWKAVPGSKVKQPYYIRLKEGRPFAYAGLWEFWRPAEGEPVHS
ncbi:MAG: SOS response-associated peptidase, partial [Candidatus Eremiobacterota bacterium]